MCYIRPVRKLQFQNRSNIDIDILQKNNLGSLYENKSNEKGAAPFKEARRLQQLHYLSLPQLWCAPAVLAAADKKSREAAAGAVLEARRP